ncbi:hypothetical protein B0H17DRAFT_1151314 [Mycena rosella]|uniref:Uncharacterized protein n=1 Tax=Mycena rosella TaxID=1033263 RepID=A0AAD7BL82_MYCRO|nr:hypothetical protein B0H17DRAFT_1151314 [Mycena rosella]
MPSTALSPSPCTPAAVALKPSSCPASRYSSPRPLAPRLRLLVQRHPQREHVPHQQVLLRHDPARRARGPHHSFGVTRPVSSLAAPSVALRSRCTTEQGTLQERPRVVLGTNEDSRPLPLHYGAGRFKSVPAPCCLPQLLHHGAGDASRASPPRGVDSPASSCCTTERRPLLLHYGAGHFKSVPTPCHLPQPLHHGAGDASRASLPRGVNFPAPCRRTTERPRRPFGAPPLPTAPRHGDTLDASPRRSVAVPAPPCRTTELRPFPSHHGGGRSVLSAPRGRVRARTPSQGCRCSPAAAPRRGGRIKSVPASPAPPLPVAPRSPAPSRCTPPLAVAPRSARAVLSAPRGWVATAPRRGDASRASPHCSVAGLPLAAAPQSTRAVLSAPRGRVQCRRSRRGDASRASLRRSVAGPAASRCTTKRCFFPLHHGAGMSRVLMCHHRRPSHHICT